MTDSWALLKMKRRIWAVMRSRQQHSCCGYFVFILCRWREWRPPVHKLWQTFTQMVAILYKIKFTVTSCHNLQKKPNRLLNLIQHHSTGAGREIVAIFSLVFSFKLCWLHWSSTIHILSCCGPTQALWLCWYRGLGWTNSLSVWSGQKSMLTQTQ